jgi:hypothetical protein
MAKGKGRDRELLGNGKSPFFVEATARRKPSGAKVA